MKKLLFLVTFLSVMLGYGQGSETFTNASLTATYSPGSFTGDNSVLWSYVDSRDESTYGITGKGIMFKGATTAKLTSATVTGGIGSFTCSLKKAFTGAGNRQVELFVNGVSKGTSIAWDNTTVQTFTVSNINVSGDIIIEVRNITSKQVTLDDISWTSYSGASSPEINIKGNNVSIANGATPATLANHTLFGTVATNTPVVRTYTIENLGSADLVLPTDPVSLTLSSPEFTIAQPALTTIPVGGSTTFSVTFNSATAGTFDDGIEVLSDDTDEANYSFDISAIAEAPTPEINIRGNFTNIVDGATTPLAADHTSFGTLATGNILTRTYTIQNTGTGDLTLTAPYVQLGTASTQYTINQPALTTIPSLGSTTFSVTFSSATAGIFDNTIEVLSDDADEATYSFAITAEAVVLNFQPGDISFTGVTTDTPDTFSFVNWVEIPVDAQFSFTDNAFDGTSLSVNESILVWRNNTGSVIPAGTVVFVDCSLATASTDLGTVVSGSLNQLSTSGDNLFIYEGIATSPNFIYGLSQSAWITSGTSNTNNSYLPEVLNVPNGNIVIGTLDNYEYTGIRSSEIAIVNYKNLVSNAANWTGNNTIFPLSSTDFTYVPVVTQLNPAACGVTLPSIYASVGSTIVAAATGYRFEVTNLTTPAEPVQVLTKSVHWFRLTELAKYDYATTYSVKVMMQIGGVWLGYYGNACIVETPSPSIDSNLCRTELSKIYSNIQTVPLSKVTSYKFKLTRGTEVQVLEKPVHWFRLSELPNYVYGATYSIELAVKTTGDYCAYGPECAITAPAIPSITECGQTVGGSYMIHTSSLSYVTQYSFEVTNLTTNEVQVINKPVHYFLANLITGYSPSTQYSIRVALTTTGIQSDFGGACVINTPAPSRIAKGNVDAEFKAVGYPNPFAANFTLNVTTTNDQNVKVQVYDMIGKQLENLEVNANESSDLQLGTNYPAGVYNVIVSQGDSVKSVRMIKR